LHLSTFEAQEKTYLERAERGMAAGSPWPCDLGPDLSRGFRALKTWFTFKVYGAEETGADDQPLAARWRAICSNVSEASRRWNYCAGIA